MDTHVVGISLGDPGGIGPEIVFKALTSYFKENPNDPTSFILFGSGQVLDNTYIQSLTSSLTIIKSPPSSKPEKHHIYFIDCDIKKDPFTIGHVSAANGLIAYRSIVRAVEFAENKLIDALVTAPISKESLLAAGILYTGHTTLLADKTNSKNVSMAFYTPKLKTVLTTIHHPLRDVPTLLNQSKLERALNNSLEFAKILKINKPKIALAGLNPHASENGMFGSEEKEILIPFATKVRNSGLDLAGPLPPDTLYYRAYTGDFDIVISLYHDQGLIPIKLIAFDTAVNVSLGLPFLRTSPDHGTAFDIAYQAKASINSFAAALDFAITYS